MIIQITLAIQHELIALTNSLWGGGPSEGVLPEKHIHSVVRASPHDFEWTLPST